MALRSGLFTDNGGPTQSATTTPIASTPTITGTAFDVTKDPNYLAAINAGQSNFNINRNQALAGLQGQQIQADQSLTNLNKTAAESRRRLAGNFAARGMAGGAYGASYAAQDRANAEQIASQTSILDQIAALNQNFLQNYGAVGSDWLGTLQGQREQTQAAQSAIAANLARMGL
jgi:hypothetical protein